MVADLALHFCHNTLSHALWLLPVTPPSLWPYFSGFDLLLPQHSASLLCLTIGIAFGNPVPLVPMLQ